MPRAQRTNAPLVVALVLFLACVAVASWLVSTSPAGGGASQRPAEGPRRTLSNPIRDMEVAAHPGRLSVTFFTDTETRCTLAADYEKARLRFRTSREKWFSKQHLLTVEQMLPGRVYFRISGETKDGATFEGTMGEAVLPAEATASATPPPTTATAGTRRPGATAPSATVVAAATPSAAPGGDDDATSTDDTPDEGSATAQAPSEDDPYRSMPPARPDTELGKRALDAAHWQVAFGPASLDPTERARIEAGIAKLRAHLDEYPDDPAAQRELGKAYFLLRDWRSALLNATRAVKGNPGDVESHGIRLAVYRKFAMGFKVQETYATLMSLRPGDEELRRAYERDTKIYGDFKTLGEPCRAVIEVE